MAKARTLLDLQNQAKADRYLGDRASQSSRNQERAWSYKGYDATTNRAIVQRGNEIKSARMVTNGAIVPGSKVDFVQGDGLSIVRGPNYVPKPAPPAPRNIVPQQIVQAWAIGSADVAQVGLNRRDFYLVNLITGAAYNLNASAIDPLPPCPAPGTPPTYPLEDLNPPGDGLVYYHIWKSVTSINAGFSGWTPSPACTPGLDVPPPNFETPFRPERQGSPTGHIFDEATGIYWNFQWERDAWRKDGATTYDVICQTFWLRTTDPEPPSVPAGLLTGRDGLVVFIGSNDLFRVGGGLVLGTANGWTGYIGSGQTVEGYRDYLVSLGVIFTQNNINFFPVYDWFTGSWDIQGHIPKGIFSGNFVYSSIACPGGIGDPGGPPEIPRAGTPSIPNTIDYTISLDAQGQPIVYLKHTPKCGSFGAFTVDNSFRLVNNAIVKYAGKLTTDWRYGETFSCQTELQGLKFVNVEMPNKTRLWRLQEGADPAEKPTTLTTEVPFASKTRQKPIDPGDCANANTGGAPIPFSARYNQAGGSQPTNMKILAIATRTITI